MNGINNEVFGNQINDAYFIQLGFNQEEINHFKYIANNNGKFTPKALQEYGYTYEQAARLSYMYRVCTGKVQVGSDDQMSRHLKKMFGHQHKLTIQDLAISKVNNVPRVAIVHDIMQEPYDIWNSKNYKGKGMLYPVIDSSGQSVTIETSRKPRLKFGQAKELPGVLEILGLKPNGNALVKFNKNYCSLCNRFIILASFKNPEYHLGKFTILCYEGRKIYVYASNMGTKEAVRYQMGNQRVYDFGLFEQDIIPKLTKVAKDMYQYVTGVNYKFEQANMRYRVVEPKKTIEDDVDEGIDF